MNVVSYGGGTNSTAMLIGMYQREIPVDLILFADTGAERPETYAYLDIFDGWLTSHGLPKIERLSYHTEDGVQQTLETELLQRRQLPSIAYGAKKCSQKYKIFVQETYCNNHPLCQAAWEGGEKVNKYIGYDAGERRRIQNATVYDMQDKKYKKVYALYEWDWDRDDCKSVIQDMGLPFPGKSSCFFCPSTKKHELLELRRVHPELLKRALAIEDNAKETLTTIKGLGRNWSWRDYLDGKDNQVMFCGMMTDIDTPCGCYDG